MRDLISVCVCDSGYQTNVQRSAQRYDNDGNANEFSILSYHKKKKVLAFDFSNKKFISSLVRQYCTVMDCYEVGPTKYLYSY